MKVLIMNIKKFFPNTEKLSKRLLLPIGEYLTNNQIEYKFQL